MNSNIITLSDAPKPDTGYFLPWTRGRLYEVEPKLKEIAEQAVAKKRSGYQAKHDAYSKAKREAWQLVGWYARDPRLRSPGAWECLFSYICNELNI